MRLRGIKQDNDRKKRRVLVDKSSCKMLGLYVKTTNSAGLSDMSRKNASSYTACPRHFIQFSSKTTTVIDFPFIKLTGALLVITSSTKNKSVGSIIYLHFTVNASQHLLTDAAQLKKQQK